MSDPNDIDLDELVDEIAGKVQEEIEIPEPEFENVETEEFPFVTPEEAQEISGATVQDHLEHLVEDDCDTPACNRIRDEFGFNDTEPVEEEETDETETEPGESETEGNTEPEAESGDESGGDGGENADETEPDSEGPANAAFPDEF